MEECRLWILANLGVESCLHQLTTSVTLGSYFASLSSLIYRSYTVSCLSAKRPTEYLAHRRHSMGVPIIVKRKQRQFNGHQQTRSCSLLEELAGPPSWS